MPAEKTTVTPTDLRTASVAYTDAADAVQQWGTQGVDLPSEVFNTHGAVAWPLVQALTEYQAQKVLTANAHAARHRAVGAELVAAAGSYESTDTELGQSAVAVTSTLPLRA